VDFSFQVLRSHWSHN